MSCSSCQGLYTGSTPCSVCNCVAQPAPVPLPECDDPNAEPCEDAVNSQCVVYTGDSLSCIGINTNGGPVRYDDILVAINNAMCQAGIGNTYITAAAGSTNCITLSGDGSQSNPIIIGLNLDPNGGITCGPNGLAASSSITLEDNVGLVWDPSNSSNLSTLYNTQQTGNSVQLLYNGGSVPSMNASVWSTMTLVQVLDAILFPTIDATYVQPTISLSATGVTAGNYEVGTALSISFTPTGRNNDAGAFSLLEVYENTYTTPNTKCSDTAPFGSVTQSVPANYGIDPVYLPTLPSGAAGTTGTNPNNDYTPSPACSSYSFSVPAGNTSWYARGTYLLGPKKKKSNGVLNTNPIAAGVILSSPLTITGIYPVFYGIVNSLTAPTTANIVSAIQTMNSAVTKKSVVSSTGTVSVNYCADFNSGNSIIDRWMWVAIPASSTIKTKVYTQWNNYLITIDNANAWNNLTPSSFVTVPNAIGSSWANVNYVIYRTKTSTNADLGNTEFRNS